MNLGVIYKKGLAILICVAYLFHMMTAPAVAAGVDPAIDPGIYAESGTQSENSSEEEEKIEETDGTNETDEIDEINNEETEIDSHSENERHDDTEGEPENETEDENSDDDESDEKKSEEKKDEAQEGVSDNETHESVSNDEAPESVSDDEAKKTVSEDGFVETSIKATIYKDSDYTPITEDMPEYDTEKNTVITLSGVLPENSYAKAYPVELKLADKFVLAAYDITIFYLDSNNEEKEFQPKDKNTGSIKVEITNDTIKDAEADKDQLSVYHAESESARPDEIEKLDEDNVNLDVTDDTVSFDAESFSAYAIVKGPSAIDMGWEKLSSLDEFKTLGSEGLFVGHTTGYYFTNKTYSPKAGRMGISKTGPESYPGAASGSVKYYFDQVPGTEDQFYAYCYVGEEKKYVNHNGSTNSLYLKGESEKTAFTVTYDSKGFQLSYNGWYWNMQGQTSGKGFCSYDVPDNDWNYMAFWRYVTTSVDAYELDGKSYGFMNWIGGVAGKAMMAKSTTANNLDALALTVMSKKTNNQDKLFVPNSSDISKWKFTWIEEDKYYLTSVVDGSTKYLKISSTGLSLVSTPDDYCKIRVIPGTGVHEGEICLKCGSATLTYSGKVDTGFCVGDTAGSEWLKLVSESELTADYFMTYSASKVSVADNTKVTNGSRVVVYTRVWNETTLKYEYFTVDYDGSLVPCYDTGDSIMWVGSRLNTELWNFVEYYWEGTTDPNYYYELYNPYAEKYVAPQVTDGQILSNSTIGINLNGRRNGYYYSTILAWDDEYYAYAGLKADLNVGKVVSCSIDEADDFYFAIMEDLSVDDDLVTVPTVDHTQYGIKMRLKNFDSRDQMSGYLGNNEGGTVTTLQQGLLSSNLGDDGYPKITHDGQSLGNILAGAQEVNNLFIANTYEGTGYYEFDSTENFASLQDDGNFKVYKEIASYDSAGTRSTLQHGQFLPYNDIKPGVFASVNNKNLYTATAEPLSESDPRKYETLYNVEHDGKKVDLQFAVDIEAVFTQTPSGLDAWGHDIIYEFTGDDDFWLYVDDVLIIDLGGIHSAVPGSVNYRTGAINENGKNTTLRAIFKANYESKHSGATESEVNAYLDEIFDGEIFKPYTTHTMRIFYMERGGGASNLRMHFNLASVKPGSVELSKELKGVDSTESVMAEFPYQIWYKVPSSLVEGEVEEKLLTQDNDDDIHVRYKDSITPVTYKKDIKAGGVLYQDACVFMLKPGETATIEMPDNTISYRIVEYHINTDIFSTVEANGDILTGTDVDGTTDRKDFGIDYAKTEDRARVKFENTVSPSALKTMTFTKRLYEEDGSTELTAEDDPSVFSFRLYLSSENEDLDLVNMHTYHVKDPDGNYCYWDYGLKKFISLGAGKDNYDALSDAEKKKTCFNTSMNGSISKIPAGYTVEVRNLLKGTKYRLVERPNEIPDGYSFQKYQIGDEVSTLTDYTDSGSTLVDASTGVTGVVSEHDPKVNVCNIRGYGLRVNKIWSDEDYMAERGDIYFAVYHDNGSTKTLLNDSVRRLKKSESSKYWYWLNLPIDGSTFEQYKIREVKLNGSAWSVDAEGVVTGISASDVIPIEAGGSISVIGKQKGETDSGTFDYDVVYEEGTPQNHSHLRVDTVTNHRPGIVLKKTDWNGNVLAGATFELKDSGGNLIGNFTSDAEGKITVAFLRDDVEYILTETKAPQGYRGLQDPMRISLNMGMVNVEGVEAKYYNLSDQNIGSTPTLTIKNPTYTFEVIKKDAEIPISLKGAEFQLHRQHTVDGVVDFDVNPMPGYETLVTNTEGIVDKIDNTLPAGTYQLREKKAPTGYQLLNEYVVFSVSDTGKVTMISTPDDVTFNETENDINGIVDYKMIVSNHSRVRLTVSKKVTGAFGEMTRQFNLTLVSVEGEKAGTEYEWTKTAADNTVTSGKMTTGGIFTLANGDSIVITVPYNKEITLQEENELYTTIWKYGADSTEGALKQLTLVNDAKVVVTNNLEAVAPTGMEFNKWPYLILILMGAVLVMVNARRKAKMEK